MTSKLLRRIHMYLALFLTPWILMYGLSTMAMNHHQTLRAFYGGPPPFDLERELDYDRNFGDDADAKQVARQILTELGLEGRFRVRGRIDHRLTILRQDPVAPRRIIYLPQEQRLTVEVQQSRIPNVLVRLHLRRGFGSGQAIDDGWAASVDLVIGAMLFWVISGVWLWWELKSTRRLGAGCLSFAIFLIGL